MAEYKLQTWVYIRSRKSCIYRYMCVISGRLKCAFPGGKKDRLRNHRAAVRPNVQSMISVSGGSYGPGRL